MDKLSHNFTSIVESPKPNMNKHCFNFIYVIGKGGFGKVWKVELKKTNKQYALKEMSKVKIIDKKSEKSINAEREFLTSLNHPFLVNMHFAFQDNDNLYLVMDLLSGGDLRYHVSRYRRFSEEQTRFFIASIVLSLDYIHKNNVIHRDIKPENLVLDDKGYVRITDFGIAKENCVDNSNETSGTPGYMSPEVMKGKNHSFAVDFFAVGVIGYEFMKGRRPYHGHNRKEIKEHMLAKQVAIKSEDIRSDWSPESADFINQLLQRKPNERLGWSNGAKDLMEHPWLKYYPWKQLEKKTLLAPFIPEKSDNFDKRYCEGIDKITEETKTRYHEIMMKKEKYIKKTFKDYYFYKEDNNNNNNEKQKHYSNNINTLEEEKEKEKEKEEDKVMNNNYIKKMEVPIIYKIPLPYKSRQDNSNTSLLHCNNINYIPNHHYNNSNSSNKNNNSDRDLNINNNSFMPNTQKDLLQIRKRIDDSKTHSHSTSLYKLMNQSSSLKSYNDSFLNKMINKNSNVINKRNVHEANYANQLNKTKVTLLKYHLRSSSVINNKPNTSKSKNSIPQIENQSQEQCNTSRQTKEPLYQLIEKQNKYKNNNNNNSHHQHNHNHSNNKIDQRKLERINSASQLIDSLSSTSNNLLNQTKYQTIYPATKR